MSRLKLKKEINQLDTTLNLKFTNINQMTTELDKYKLNLKMATVYYIPNFIPKDQADIYMQSILKSVKFEKKKHEGRETALHGDAKQYRYAFNDAIPEKWTDELLAIKSQLETNICPDYNYDVCLLNYYPNGKTGFKFHSDKEELGNEVPIASISFGAKRKFYFKQIASGKDNHSIDLEHGSLLIMGPGTHENYIHSLPTDNKIKEPRSKSIE